MDKHSGKPRGSRALRLAIYAFTSISIILTLGYFFLKEPYLRFNRQMRMREVLFGCKAFSMEHGNKFPQSLGEIRAACTNMSFVTTYADGEGSNLHKSLPELQKFWDEADEKIELVTPGISETAPDQVVLREKKPDRAGYKVTGWLGGYCVLQKKDQ